MIKDFSGLLYANKRPFCRIIITVLHSSSESVKIAHNKAREREELSVAMTAIKSPLYEEQTKVWKKRAVKLLASI